MRQIDDVTLRSLSEDRHGWVSMQVNQGRAVVHGVALETRLPLKRWTLRADLARNWSRIVAVGAG